MDFELSEDQLAITEAVGRLLEQRAGAARAIELNAENSYDSALHQALDDSGFSHIARDLQSGEKLAGLEAALIVEAIACAGGVVACGAQMLVAPALAESPITGPITLCTRRELNEGTPLRFAAQASSLLILERDSVTHAAVDGADREAVRSSFGYPMGRLKNPAQLQTITAFDSAAADSMRNWWRVALAVEAAGTMDAALHHVVDYLKQRRQFGRTIGSFQAVQHRLSLCAIQVEASRWLAREAAYNNATAQASAAAAAFALDAADLVFTETHQLSGAIGFTHEFDLHVWSMRLLALRQELGGVGGARRDLVQSRWSGTR